jgi:ATP-binding cassette, subfamily C, bacterial LapB
METPAESSGEGALKIAKLQGAIEFKGVNFSYPDATEKALQDVSLRISPGEKVALLGRIGSGKSTIARLILGLYPPESGLVMIDGTEVRQLDTARLRGHTGVVLQDTVLLSGTVRDNIKLDRPEVDDEELLRAAQVSGTHEFMGRLANGYDLRLADRGESLSGGQRQSIALARAIAGRPSLLILDEPTSAMDNQTEQALLTRLAQEVQDRTLILITHRPTLLRLVTRIILLDQGRIVADGPRDAILKQISGKQVTQ